MNTIPEFVYQIILSNCHQVPVTFRNDTPKNSDYPPITITHICTECFNPCNEGRVVTTKDHNGTK